PLPPDPVPQGPAGIFPYAADGPPIPPPEGSPCPSRFRRSNTTIPWRASVIALLIHVERSTPARAAAAATRACVATSSLTEAGTYFLAGGAADPRRRGF